MEKINEIAVKAKNFYKQGNYLESFSLYEQLAKKNHIDSQIFLGWMYHKGVGKQKNDDMAYKWFERAANRGSVEGMFYVGRLLTELGRHIEALNWYKKSAEKTYGPALFCLGNSYEKALGAEADSDLAYTYFKQAAAVGHLYAKRKIAIHYVRGRQGMLKIIKGVVLFWIVIVKIVRLRLKDEYAVEIKA